MLIGAGTKILGNITVGDRAKIGALAQEVRDVAPLAPHVLLDPRVAAAERPRAAAARPELGRVDAVAKVARARPGRQMRRAADSAQGRLDGAVHLQGGSSRLRAGS